MAKIDLYPPVVLDAYPASLNTQPYRIYFAFPSYNKPEDVAGIQLSVRDQRTNKSVFKKPGVDGAYQYFDTYKHHDIKIFNWEVKGSQTDKEFSQIFIDPEREASGSEYKYYVNILPWEVYQKINSTYIIQLRFTSIDAPAPEGSQSKNYAQWLAKNPDYFSEWSTVSLIKFINPPTITLKDLVEFDKNKKDNVNVFSSLFVNLVGNLSFQNKQEKETLKSYNITVQSRGSGDNAVDFNTGEIYTNTYNPNEINYTFDYDFPRDITHDLILTYTTNNGYSQKKYYQFKISSSITSNLSVLLTVEPEPTYGRMKVNINFDLIDTAGSKADLIIERTSYRTNFKVWENLATIPNKREQDNNKTGEKRDSSQQYLWNDTSIESGVWYKYRIRQDTENGKYIETKEPCMCDFEDIFLTSGDQQLKIQFNPAVGDFKYNVIESQQVALGAQYPYIRRNGNTFYRTFSISGLISSFMNDDTWMSGDYDPDVSEFIYPYQNQPFVSKSDVYKKMAARYESYNNEKKIDSYNDYIWEREFRQKVMDFLYRNDIKLFRSLTQGNIMVKLMGISFQPIESLGRRLYSFSATAVEIDSLNVKNLIKYNLLNKNYYAFRYAKLTAEVKVQPFESIFEKAKDAIEISTDEFVKVLHNLLRVEITTTKPFSYIDVQIKYQGKNTLTTRTTNEFYLKIQNNGKYNKLEDCWFEGWKADQFVVESKQYDEKPKNPQDNHVYQILNDDGILRVDDYISYNDKAELLITTEDQVPQRPDETYALIVKRYYNKYIYYKGQFYPFSNDGKILTPNITATIDFYYTTKEVLD